MVRLAHIALGLFLVVALAACSPGGGGPAQPDGPAPTSAPAASSGY